jgi:hypothetical protein
MMIFFLRYALIELIERLDINLINQESQLDEAFDFSEMSLLLNSVL